MFNKKRIFLYLSFIVIFIIPSLSKSINATDIPNNAVKIDTQSAIYAKYRTLASKIPSKRNKSFNLNYSDFNYKKEYFEKEFGYLINMSSEKKDVYLKYYHRINDQRVILITYDKVHKLYGLLSISEYNIRLEFDTGVYDIYPNKDKTELIVKAKKSGKSATIAKMQTGISTDSNVKQSKQTTKPVVNEKIVTGWTPINTTLGSGHYLDKVVPGVGIAVSIGGFFMKLNPWVSSGLLAYSVYDYFDNSTAHYKQTLYTHNTCSAMIVTVNEYYQVGTYDAKGKLLRVEGKVISVSYDVYDNIFNDNYNPPGCNEFSDSIKRKKEVDRIKKTHNAKCALGTTNGKPDRVVDGQCQCWYGLLGYGYLPCLR